MRHSAALGDRRLIAECTAFPAPIFVHLRQRAGDEPNPMVIGSARRHDWRFVPKRQSVASARATNAETPSTLAQPTASEPATLAISLDCAGRTIS
jgi:hypothetical protein